MRQYLTNFFQEFEYEREDADFFLAAYDALFQSAEAREGFEQAFSLYEKNHKADFSVLLQAASAAGRRVGMHPYTAELLFCFCLSRRLRALYAERGLSDDIYRETILDLRYKLGECKRVKGIRGSFVASWFDGFFNLTRFAFGRLQFEWTTFRHEYQKDGLCLTPDSSVINVHIPGSGAPLTEAACEDSYARAYAFFRHEAEGPVAFVCHSWLLFPAHAQMLPAHSNIRRFMARFDIISHGPLRNGDDLWRIFDTDEKNPARLPADSSLRRAYLDLLRAGGETGFGFGVFFYP